MRWIALATALLLFACGTESGGGADTTVAEDTGHDDTVAVEDTLVEEDTTPVDTTPPLEPWQHEGPITRAAPTHPTPPYFTEVTAEVGLEGFYRPDGRAMVVDFDGDGRDDLALLPVSAEDGERRFPTFARAAGPNADGVPQFVDVTAESGMNETEAIAMVFGDIDNDGDQDAFTGIGFRAPGGRTGAWLNDGTGHFVVADNVGILPSTLGSYEGETVYKEQNALGLADLDRDGFLDVYIGTWYSGAASVGGGFLPPDDELYKGDGAGNWTFVKLPDQTDPKTLQMNPSWGNVSRAAYGLAMADFDDDGDVDIFVNNYGAGRPALGSPPSYFEQNFLWRNDGRMVFVDVAPETGVNATVRGIGGVQEESPVVYEGETYPGPIGGNGFGCQWGDLDNDGDLDLAVGTIAHPDYPQADRTLLHYNQGPDAATRFTEESAERGLEYNEDELHPALVDVDNDGRLDFAMSRLRGGSKWELYFQGSRKSFEKATWEESGVDIEEPGPSLWFDYDGDGDLDFFMPKDGGRLFRNNNGQANHRLVLELVATAPRDATGARVTLTTLAGVQVREVTSGHGHYNTQFTRKLYFGLGGDSGAADVTIRWPDGEVQVLGDVKADLHLRVTQGGTVEML
ncbi:MAG: CRTAC1 family protein [Deltaproteobacteria bacterium]|nr:MAG: CRTAC1 family protein [Deltaproteobacteria bacterium]